MARPLRVVGRAAIAALPLLFGGAAPAQLRASPPPEAGFVAEDLARRTVACGATLLMVTAHPDDEDNALAAMLRRRHGVRVVLWTMTRGEGGQNEIGDEQGEALALLRDAELEAAHRFDGIEQFPYDRDVPPFPDFGYSFSWAETMEKWAPARPGLGASRAVLQRVKPEVVLVMDPDWDGGGQHHQASAVLMLEECVLERNPWRDDGLAADGAPWHVPRKAYAIDPSNWRSAVLRRASRPAPTSAPTSAPTAPTDSRPWRPAATAPVEEVDVDLFDPWLGRTYRELAAEARSMHKSQGMSRTLEPIGPPKRRYRLLIDRTTPGAGRPDAPPLFGGVDFAPKPAPPQPPVRVTASAERADYSGGDVVVARVDVASAGATAVAIRSARLLLAHGGASTPFAESRPTSGDDASTLRLSGKLPGLVSVPLWFSCEATVRADGAEHVVVAPLVHRHAGDVLSGEQVDPVAIAPPWDVRLEPSLVVASTDPTERPRPLRVRVRRNARGTAQVSVALTATDPALRIRWRSASTVEVSQDEERLLEADVAWDEAFVGPATVRAELDVVEPAGESATFRVRYDAPVGVRAIDYPHVTRRSRALPAEVRVTSVPLRRPPPTRVGYVQGVGERTAALLPQLGATVDLVDAEALATSDLARFDVLVIGARAYEFRPDLRAHHRRLMDRVAGGGVLICQYQKSGLPFAPYAPFEATVGAGRVTDENGPVEHLVSDHPALTAPNRLGVDDWRGWFRDRSLYHLEPAAATRDRYVDLVKPFDTFGGNAGPHLGALVEARVGKGRWIYCGLALWRQLPEAVPGAWRLWANLLALRGD